MWNYLRSLQEKPLHTRKMATYVLTIFLFALIVFLWILLLNIQKVDESKTSHEGILSPFEGIKEAFTKVFKQIDTTNIPAIPQGMNEGGTINPSNMNSETSYNATNTEAVIGTTTLKHATGTPL